MPLVYYPEFWYAIGALCIVALILAGIGTIQARCNSPYGRMVRRYKEREKIARLHRKHCRRMARR